jgi:hypothetical protein
MADDRQTMYDEFSDKCAHSVEWFEITKGVLKLAFADGRREASCPCSRCENRRMLSEYEMSAHLNKKGFMSNYLMWHQHREVQPPVADESDENDDEHWMDNMVGDIGRGYDLRYVGPSPEVHNFYRFLAISEEKVHEGTDVTVLHAVTHLMAMKSKYNFSNQCYNERLILVKKTYTSQKLLSQ